MDPLIKKVARDTGVIDEVPDTPRRRQKDNPRPFFRFHPLVPKERDAYKALLKTARELAEQGEEIRGVPLTDELYDLVLFVTHSFVRPISTELYALRHADVEVAENPKRLLLTVRNGKTGYRHSNSMPAAVAVYKRICQKNPDHKAHDFLFFPDYPNRATASRGGTEDRPVHRDAALALLAATPATSRSAPRWPGTCKSSEEASRLG